MRGSGLTQQTIQAVEETADATKQLVMLNRETGKQTRWMIALTIIIAILTLIMAIPILKDIYKLVSQNFI